MALVALLVIALVCLAVGLVLPSVAWLIASLIATAGAAFLLVKARSTILAPRTAGASVDAVPAEQDSDSTTVLPRVDEPADSTTVLPRVDEPADSSGPDESADVPPADGAASTAAERAPAGDTAPAHGETGTSVPDYAAGPDDVWVIDGRPRYHVRKCVIIQGQDAEPIPFDQAVEDGFMPCSLCEPQLARAAAQEV